MTLDRGETGDRGKLPVREIVDSLVPEAIDDLGATISDAVTGLDKKLDSSEHQTQEEFKAARYAY